MSLLVLVDVLLERLLLLFRSCACDGWKQCWAPMTTPFLARGAFPANRSSRLRRRRPKMACSSFSSGVSSLLLLGAILPTRMSPGPTRVPTRTTPFSSRLARARSETLGMFPRVELFAAELGLADFDVVLFDVDRGEGDVLLHQPLADDDGVFEVVAIERS